MGINATIKSLLAKSPGNSSADSSRIRSAKQFNPVDIANAVDSIQRQLNAVVNALQANTSVQDFTVTDKDGALIGWIGSQVVSGASYVGAWFKQIWIGGTNAANAVISTDTSGNVTINGAMITLNSNGVTTTIQNTNSGLGVLSLKSLDNGTGFWSAVTPFGFSLADNTAFQVALLGSSGGHGALILKDNANSNNITLRTNPGGVRLAVFDGTDTGTVGPGTFLVNGTNVISAARVVTGTDVVTPKLNGGTIPTSGPVALNGSQQLVAATAGTGISLGATSITNTGVTSAVAGSGISVSAATGAVTITNTQTSFPGGSTHVAPLAALTGGGAQGSLTFTNGVLTAFVDPT